MVCKWVIRKHMGDPGQAPELAFPWILGLLISCNVQSQIFEEIREATPTKVIFDCLDFYLSIKIYECK